MNEFEMDKERFGAFVAGERRRLGVTQRELAQRLFISDKAVSKWERGLSLPDVSLLIPLAELLGVTVTELLEGRRLERSGEMEVEQVERLVKRTLTMAEGTPAEARENRRRRGVVWLGCTAWAALELLGFFLLGSSPSGGEWTLLGLSFFFGCWAWLWARERLPAFYDENPISFYTDGILELSMPGLTFNNSNWPRILWGLRIWSMAGMLLLPLLSAAGQWLLAESWYGAGQFVLLLLYLDSLFLPVYGLGKRYEKPQPSK